MPDSSNTNHHLCPICGLEPYCDGLGVVKYEVPFDDPRFGKFFRCPNNPAERDNVWQQKLREVGNLSAYAEKTFSNFYIELPYENQAQIDSLQYALNTALRYAEAPEGWLLFEGGFGCGKTHLAAAIANYRLQQGDVVLFVTTPDLLDHLRSTYSPSSEITYDDTFERVRNASLLILDDLGVENPSQWAQEKLFQILNHRHTLHLPTIITTNTDVTLLDPRVSSRVVDINLTRRVVINAPDYRNPHRLASAEENIIDSNLYLYRDYTFDSFEVDQFANAGEKQNLSNVKKHAHHYAKHPEGWLLLLGGVGSGKTHLAAAMANYRDSQGDDVMFLSTTDLLDYLRKAFVPDAKTSFDKRFYAVKNIPFLVLDDLSTENASPWAREKLFQIMDYRYITRLPTVITSSKNLDELDLRIRLRLLDDRLCKTLAITIPESYVMRRRRQ